MSWRLACSHHSTVISVLDADRVQPVSTHARGDHANHAQAVGPLFHCGVCFVEAGNLASMLDFDLISLLLLKRRDPCFLFPRHAVPFLTHRKRIMALPAVAQRLDLCEKMRLLNVQ